MSDVHEYKIDINGSIDGDIEWLKKNRSTLKYAGLGFNIYFTMLCLILDNLILKEEIQDLKALFNQKTDNGSKAHQSMSIDKIIEDTYGEVRKPKKVKKSTNAKRVDRFARPAHWR